MSEADSQSTRHADRMARKKTVVDAAIARATETRGLLLVLTGILPGNARMQRRLAGLGLQTAQLPQGELLPSNPEAAAALFAA